MASKGSKAPTTKASSNDVGKAVLGSGGSFWTVTKTKAGTYRWVPYVTKYKKTGGTKHVATKTKKQSRSKKSSKRVSKKKSSKKKSKKKSSKRISKKKSSKKKSKKKSSKRISKKKSKKI